MGVILMVLIEGKKYLSTFEVAQQLGKSQEYIRRWCRDKIIEAKKIGTNYFIPEDELENLKKYFSVNTMLKRNWKKLV
uniref:DNA-binding protein n=1 Tax=Fervidobacterium pennivorans TaxID=93466 RepID=A0A7C4VVC4_FERPE